MNSLSNMKIIFDFDHTLFSTPKLVEAMEEAFSDLGIGEKVFWETFKKAKGKGGSFSPEKHMRLIDETEAGVSIPKLRKTFQETLNRCSEFLFPDVVDFLERNKEEFDFYILSYGEEDFQRAKIRGCNIEKFFEDVLITSRVKKDSALKSLLREEEKAMIVDDNPQVLVENKKHFPNLLAVRINRGEGRYADLERDSRIDFSIENLDQLEKIIKDFK